MGSRRLDTAIMHDDRHRNALQPCSIIDGHGVLCRTPICAQRTVIVTSERTELVTGEPAEKFQFEWRLERERRIDRPQMWSAQPHLLCFPTGTLLIVFDSTIEATIEATIETTVFSGRTYRF